MKKGNKFKLLVIAFSSVIALFATACEELAPNNYIKQNYVEAYLIVDEPINSVKIMETQPLDKPYNIDNSFIKDADVKITVNNTTYTLAFSEQTPKGYYIADTSVKVLPNCKYKLSVTLKDGTILTAETHTPNRFQWIIPPKDTCQFPSDTIKLPSNDSIKWTINNKPLYYMVNVVALDTLEYGKYLTPATNEKNRRTYSIMNRMEGDPSYTETANYGMLGNTVSPYVWLSFKWFGRNKVIIYCPDFNYLQWLMQYYTSQQSGYNPLLGNIKNGIGIFCSASKIEKEVFLLKNQP